MPAKPKSSRGKTPKGRTSNLQIVFIDIEKYSKRPTTVQIQTVDSFTRCLHKSITRTIVELNKLSRSKQVNSNKVISIPTGDGAAVIFPFELSQPVHLLFARTFLKTNSESNERNHCARFVKQGWCKCHANFYVRIGVSEGRGIIYRDINGNRNIAGSVINMASRVMGLVGRSQIAFTEDAYRQVVEFGNDPDLEKCFREFTSVMIKHDLNIDMYQYLGSDGDGYIDRKSPTEIRKIKALDVARATTQQTGLFRFCWYDQVDWLSLFAEARKVGVVAIAATSLFGGNQVGLIKDFLRRPGTKLQLVLADADDEELMKYYDAKFEHSTGTRRQRIQASRESILSIAKEVRATTKVLIRQTSRLPAYSCYRFDEKYLFVPYLTGPERSPERIPVFFFKSSPFVRKFLGHDLDFVFSPSGSRKWKSKSSS